VLNKFGPSGHGEAQVQYLDGDFRVISPGTFVRCAITDTRIPRDELKYWSVDLQEAYATPAAVLQRHFPGALKPQPFIPSPAFSAKRIFFADNTTKLFALDAATGATVWRKTLPARTSTALVVVADMLVLGPRMAT